MDIYLQLEVDGVLMAWFLIFDIDGSDWYTTYTCGHEYL